jgi:hypothetical protein
MIPDEMPLEGCDSQFCLPVSSGLVRATTQLLRIVQGPWRFCHNIQIQKASRQADRNIVEATAVPVRLHVAYLVIRCVVFIPGLSP